MMCSLRCLWKGKDSFFKSHKDTPRGNRMFGSLVVSFPTLHEGGALVLRHKGEEWTVDSSKLLSGRQDPSITYVAFYSDVEHEVMTVTSGYRVTLTYNLYFSVNPKSALAGIRASDVEDDFKNALSALLDDEEFMPEGGNLGFGLQHQYPLSRRGSLDSLYDCLKSNDAVIYRACNNLSLDTALMLLYEGEDDEDHDVMVDDIVNMEGDIQQEYRHETDLLWCEGDYGGQPVVAADSPGKRDRVGDTEIYWITEPTGYSRLETPFVAYGNEASLAFMYGDLFLIVTVGPFGERATVQ
jgi:hypothetical protein